GVQTCALPIYLLAGNDFGYLGIIDTSSWNYVGKLADVVCNSSSLAFSIDGKKIASSNDSSDRVIRISEVPSGKLLSKLIVQASQQAGEAVWRVSFVGDGSYLVSQTFDFRVLWNLRTGKPAREYDIRPRGREN